MFGGMYGRLQTKLKTTPGLCVSTVSTVKMLQAKCTECKPTDTVLLFTNEIIAKKKDLHGTVKHFVNTGGLVIIGCLFGSFTTQPLTDALFKAFGLPWKSSQQYRTTFGVTDVGSSLLSDVAAKYSAKALQLSDVRSEQKLYKPVEGATTESVAFSSDPADANLVMAAFGKIGRGAVAYVGDLNQEEDTDRLIIALCLAVW